MDFAEAIHTSARRYCMTRYSFWVDRYSELRASDRGTKPIGGSNFRYTEDAYDVFPRYLVWQAILDEVERTQPQPIMTPAALRRELIEAGRRAQTLMTDNPGLPANARRAMDEEREDFARFVASTTEDQVRTAEPLPFRRVFSKQELPRLWDSLRTKWGIDPSQYWWPLREGHRPGNTIAFHSDWFDETKVAATREALVEHGVGLVWELREGGDWGCESQVRSFDPKYTGAEGYWTSSALNWLVYASHESSITVVGQWLIDYLERTFPGTERFEYRGPKSTPDLRGTWDF